MLPAPDFNAIELEVNVGSPSNNEISAPMVRHRGSSIGEFVSTKINQRMHHDMRRWNNLMSLKPKEYKPAKIRSSITLIILTIGSIFMTNLNLEHSTLLSDPVLWFSMSITFGISAVWSIIGRRDRFRRCFCCDCCMSHFGLCYVFCFLCQRSV